MEKPVLETAAQAFAEANANPPFLFDLGPAEGRKVLDGVQSPEIEVPGTVKESLTAPVGPTGTVSVTVFRPAGSASPLPVIFYIHGAGWVFGDDHTHDRLARELAKGVGAAVVFLNYDRSPEARYPVAIEQAYAAARWVVEHGAGHGLGAARMAVAGDSVGQRPAGDGAGVVPVAGAQVRWARACRQAVTPLLVSTPRPSGNAVARACRAAWRSCS